MDKSHERIDGKAGCWYVIEAGGNAHAGPGFETRHAQAGEREA